MAVTHIRQGEFTDKVENGKGIQVVDFFATWCGPCKMLAPILEQTAAANPDVNFYKVDIDEEIGLAQKFQVMSVPTLLFVKDGKVVDKSVGVIPAKQLEGIIEKCKNS